VKYDRFVCLCPRFPEATGTSDRAAMGHELRERVEAGASLLFMYETSLPADGGASAWLFSELTGAALHQVAATANLELETTRACSPRVADYLDDITSHVWIRTSRADALAPSLDAQVVLAGLERPEHRPVAIATFVGERGGSWLALPFTADPAREVDVAALLLFFDDLERLRRRAVAPTAGRPKPGSKPGRALAALEYAAGRGGGFVANLDTKAVSRLKRNYGFAIESADEARERGEAVDPGAKGHRLRPGSAEGDAR
jgi:hypothetical protein